MLTYFKCNICLNQSVELDKEPQKAFSTTSQTANLKGAFLFDFNLVSYFSFYHSQTFQFFLTNTTNTIYENQKPYEDKCLNNL